MTRQEFLVEIDGIVDLPPGTLKGPEKLKELKQWTSLAVVSYMALADDNNGISLSPQDIGKCVTVSDLLDVAKVEPAK